jgi:hypothetical protein
LWVCVCVVEESARTSLRATPFARRTELLGEQERKSEVQNLEPPRPAPFAKDAKSAAPQFKILQIESEGSPTRRYNRCMPEKRRPFPSMQINLLPETLADKKKRITPVGEAAASQISPIMTTDRNRPPGTIRRLFDFVEQPLVTLPLGIIGGIVGTLFYAPVLVICGICILLGFHRAKVVAGRRLRVQLPAYLLLAVVTAVGFYGLHIRVQRALQKANMSISDLIVAKLKPFVEKIAQTTQPTSSMVSAPSTSSPTVKKSEELPHLKPEHPKSVMPNVVPPLHGTEQFVTYVVWSPAGILCPNNMKPIRRSICIDVMEFSKGHIGQDVPSSIGEVFQRYFVALVWAAGQGWGYHTSPANGHWAEANVLPMDPPESINYIPNKLLDTSSDRFYPWWFLNVSNDKHMKLPKDTTITFSVEPPQEHQNAYVTIFERKGYYQLELSAYAYGAPMIGAVPEGYELPDTNIAQLKTYRFVVRSDWVLQRAQTSFVVEDYDKWAKELFMNIRQKLEN